LISGGLKRFSFILSALLLATVPKVSAGEIEDTQTIGLFSEETPEVATSPIPRPISRIAENVTVITAEDIARINAHTVADVLQTVPGIQLDFAQRTPGTFTFFNIQGALNSTVLVLVDGIRQNDFDQNTAWPNTIPVQQIDRIEIIKGAASGSWGSALGGVVNIVTKSPDPDRTVSGMVSSSVGSRFTTDSRGELSGTKNGVGYYLSAGHLASDGLSRNTSHNTDNLYGKLSYTLPGAGTLTAGVSHVAAGGGEGEGTIPGLVLFAHRGGGAIPPSIDLSVDSEVRHTYGFLKYQQLLGNKLVIDILGYGSGRDDDTSGSRANDLGVFVKQSKYHLHDTIRGLNASISWGDSSRNLVAGGEYLHGHGSNRDILTFAPPTYDKTWDSYAAYLNGTYTIGDLAILPGVRFDGTGFSGDHMSYTLGLTYQLTEQTTLRAYAAEGFALPMLTFDTGTQKVRTVQGGVETGAIPFFWFKATYFSNTLHNAASVGSVVSVTDQHGQGFELEGRTTPLYGLFLSGGYTWLHAEEDSGHRLQTNGQQSVPPQVYKVAVNYDYPSVGVNGALTGSGVYWNASPGYPARSVGMIWDLSINWKPVIKDTQMPELFFVAHNLFDALQTTNTYLCPTATQWFEGGARFRF
jgi:vitamin B12 transporter